MKIQKIFLIFLCALFTRVAAGAVPFRGFQRGQSSIAIFAGQPTFVRYSKFLNWKRSWSFDAGWHFDKYPYFAGNYTFYFYDVRDRYKNQDFFNKLMFYSGPGVFLGPDFSEKDNDKKIKVGVRLFGGTEYIFLKTNLSLKAELGPALFIEGDKFFGFQAMIGLTYYIGGISPKEKVRKSIDIENF